MTDRRTVTYVVAGLASTLVVSVLGVIVLAALGVAIPDVLSNLAVGTLGALAAMLARTSSGPEDVHVVNPPDEPVPVAPGDDEHAGHGDVPII